MVCTADTLSMIERNGNWEELTEGKRERELTGSKQQVGEAAG
jgi:hypothetical protein